ncbi:MAG: alkylhydroperoxidase-related (seleno)protein [Rhodospirillales bacterium]|jgi:hypothetical protein|nr:alkylhydroperoxidase-related (seleno)protein [Rhodospirillales bacterium]
MTESYWGETSYTIRYDISRTHEQTWQGIAGPGTWLTGDTRAAIAAETRAAQACELCALRKEALSPYAVPSGHEAGPVLSAAELDAVHRIATDPGRLSSDWYIGQMKGAMEQGAYVELAGIVAMVMMMDGFCRAMDLPQTPVPQGRSGEPSRYSPPGARMHEAWVPVIKPEDVVEEDGPLYGGKMVSYVRKALSSVPDALRAYWNLADAHYLPGADVGDFGTELRAISRPQIEVVASRVAAVHQCVY